MSRVALTMVVAGPLLVGGMALLHRGLPSWDTLALRLARFAALVGALMSIAGFLLLV